MKARALLLLAGLCCPVRAQESCPAARDLVVRALELVSAHSKTSDLEDGLQLLKHAAQSCAEMGDAWYYRSLFERQLKHAREADYALGKARLLGSDALKEGEDPFHLATPLSRDLDESRAPVIQPLPHGPLPAPVFGADVADKWALVVGISNFQERRLKLRYTKDDAEALAALLRDPSYGRFRPDHVRLLEDEQGTTVQIKAALNWLARMAGPGDLVLIYVSTHGSARELDLASVNYLITHDTDVNSKDGLYATALPMIELSNVVRTRIRARKAVVLLDTCHSAGAIAQTVAIPAALSPAALERIREGSGRAILASSTGGEKSYELEKSGHGLFTYRLLEALKLDGGNAPIQKIYDYVSSHVAEDAAAFGKKQHPVLSLSDRQTAVIVGAPPQAPRLAVAMR